MKSLREATESPPAFARPTRTIFEGGLLKQLRKCVRIYKNLLVRLQKIFQRIA